MLCVFVLVFSYSCDYITNVLPNRPPMKTGVKSPYVRVSCHYVNKQRIRYGSPGLVIYSLLKE